MVVTEVSIKHLKWPSRSLKVTDTSAIR